jgi:cell division protein FtsX
MNKLLLIAMTALLGISLVCNFIQYNNTKILSQKLSLFETRFGSYESLSASIKQADEAKAKREQTISIYIKPATPESEIDALKNLIEKQNWVASVEYISASQVLADFKTEHQNDQATLQALEELGTNPLGGTLTVTLTDSTQKPSIVSFINTSKYNSIIDHIN